MAGPTILNQDSSWQSFTTTETLPKARFHQDLAINVNTNTWYLYHQRNYTGDNYAVGNWFELS